MFKKSFFVKIPKNINIYVDLKKKYFLIKSIYNKKLVKINSEILKVIKTENKIVFLYVTDFFTSNRKNIIKKRQKEMLLILKRMLLDVSFKSCKKLQLNGIGYKISIIQHKFVSIIHLKLGYSHSVYFKLPDHINAKITKNNILFLFGNSIERLSLIAGLIKNCKRPDPYKGKGILYVGENINLKVGKKS